MTATLLDDGDWRLRGSHDDFDALLRDLGTEVDEGFAPKKNIPALLRIIKYITPEGDDELF